MEVRRRLRPVEIRLDRIYEREGFHRAELDGNAPLEQAISAHDPADARELEEEWPVERVVFWMGMRGLEHLKREEEREMEQLARNSGPGQ